MTTYNATNVNIQRLLQDNPDQDVLAAAITTTTTTTFTPTDVTRYATGQVWEFQDGDESANAEQVLVTSVDSATPAITMRRASNGSGAATHLISTLLFREPRFPYNSVAQAVATVLDTDLYQNGIFDIQEHQITSSATTNAYSAPTASCEEFTYVYQRIAATDPPLPIRYFDRQPRNVDTSLWATGRVFEINDNYGTPGSSLYYVNCKHRLAIGTLAATQERIVQLLAAAYLLEWAEPRRVAGPTNQGDRTVRPGQGLSMAGYYRQLADKMIQAEASYLRSLQPGYKVFRKSP